MGLEWRTPDIQNLIFQVKKLTQSSLPSYIEAALFSVFLTMEKILCDLGTKMWQMFPKCKSQSYGCCRKVEPITEDKGIADFSCALDFQSSFPLSTVSSMTESSLQNLVYKRRNSRGNSAVILSEQVPDITRRSGDCFSVISSDAPLVATRDQNLGPQVEHKIQVTQAPVLSPLLCNSKPHISNSEFISGYSVGEAPKRSVQRNLEVDSVNESCSSSKSNMEHVLSSMKTELDETGECSSSSATVKEDIQGDLSEKDFCISILRSHGLIGGVWEIRTCASAENIETVNGDSCCRSCKICGRSETTTNLLICDHCEESFHMSCCNPRIKKIPTDEWFCHSCLKKRYKILKKTVKGKANHIASVMSGAKNMSSKGESNAIMLMLRDTEPYTTGVRIGKGFQAEVPDWSGPINRCVYS